MSTGSKVALAVVGVALIYLVWQRQTAVAPSVAVAATAAAGPGVVNQIANGTGQVVGSVTAGLVGAPALGPLISQDASAYVKGNASAIKQVGSGFVDIGNGNVWSGAKSIGSGAAEEVYTASGAKGLVAVGKDLGL